MELGGLRADRLLEQELVFSESMIEFSKFLANFLRGNGYSKSESSAGGRVLFFDSVWVCGAVCGWIRGYCI